MIADFADFCLWMYVMVDELWRQLSAAAARRLNGRRQIIETVNDQLTAQFALAAHHAHTFLGLCAPLHEAGRAYTLHLPQPLPGA